VITNFKQISPALLDALRRNPKLVALALELDRQILDTSFGPLQVRTRMKKQLDRLTVHEREFFYKRNAGLINQILARESRSRLFDRKPENIADPEFDEALLAERDSANELCLDRADHLHRLLCDEPWETSTPLCRAINGGADIGGVLECGPARFLTVVEVRDVSIELGRISEDDLRLKLDSGTIDYEDVNSGDLPCSLRGFAALRDFYKDASSRGDALLLYETWYPPLLHS